MAEVPAQVTAALDQRGARVRDAFNGMVKDTIAMLDAGAPEHGLVASLRFSCLTHDPEVVAELLAWAVILDAQQAIRNRP